MKKLKLITNFLILVLFVSSCGGKYAEVQKEIEEYQKLSCLTTKGITSAMENSKEVQRLMESEEGGAEKYDETTKFSQDYMKVQLEMNERITVLGEIFKEYGAEMSDEEKKAFGIVLLTGAKDCGLFEDYMKSVLENETSH